MSKGLKTLIIVFMAILLAGVGLFYFLTRQPDTTKDAFNTPKNEFEEYVDPIVRDNNQYTVTLYVPNADGTGLIKKTVTYTGEGIEIQQAIFKDIFVSNKQVILPSGVKLNGMKIWNETLNIDLSKEIMNTVCSDHKAEKMFITSIVNSMLGSSNQFTDVQFLVDGERVDKMLGHVNTKNPLAFQ